MQGHAGGSPQRELRKTLARSEVHGCFHSIFQNSPTCSAFVECLIAHSDRSLFGRVHLDVSALETTMMIKRGTGGARMTTNGCGRRSSASFADRETREPDVDSQTTSRSATPCREGAW